MILIKVLNSNYENLQDTSRFSEYNACMYQKLF